MELFVGSVVFRYTYAVRRDQLQGTLRRTTVLGGSTDVERRAQTAIRNLDYALPPYCVLEYHGQLQTIMQFCVRNALRVVKSMLHLPSSIVYQRELLQMPDGGTVGLDWAERPWASAQNNKPKDAPIIILHHGLVGDSQSEYIYHLADHFLNNGFRVVVMVARGCGGMKLTSAEIFAGRRASDCAHCIQHVKERYREAKLFWIGFSLGAALTLQYLADNHEEILKRAYTGQPAPTEEELKQFVPAGNPLTAAMTVCPPWNVAKNGGLVAPLWLALLATPLKLHFTMHQPYLNEQNFDRYGAVTPWKLLWCRNMTEIDNLLYPTHFKASGGRYTSLNEYYEDISPIHSAYRINTPTLVLSARDDPVCDHTHAPTDRAQLGPGVAVVSTPYGGHLAYPEGVLPTTLSWADRVAVAWFKSFL